MSTKSLWTVIQTSMKWNSTLFTLPGQLYLVLGSWEHPLCWGSGCWGWGHHRDREAEGGPLPLLTQDRDSQTALQDCGPQPGPTSFLWELIEAELYCSAPGTLHPCMCLTMAPSHADPDPGYPHRSWSWPHLRAYIPTRPQPIPIPREVPDAPAWDCPWYPLAVMLLAGVVGQALSDAPGSHGP